MYYLKYLKIPLFIGSFIFLQAITNNDIPPTQSNGALSTTNKKKIAVGLSVALAIPIAHQYYEKIRKELPLKIVEKLRSEDFSYPSRKIDPSINGEKKIQNNSISLENELTFSNGYFGNEYPFLKTLFCWNPKFFSRILEWLDPIFFLEECTISYCPYTRKSQSSEKSHESRESYENRLTREVVSKLKRQNPLEYVSFGSGGMLQDFVSIQKILKQKPDASLSLHFIDANYLNFLSFSNSSEYLEEYKKSDKFQDFIKKHPYLGDMAFKGLIIDYRRKQFINCLKKQFPKAQIQLNLYANLKEYIAYLQKNKDHYPDILTTIDIDFGDWGQLAVADYTVLLCFIKKNSPKTSIVSLLHPALSQLVSNVVAKTINGPYNEERINKEYWSALKNKAYIN